MGRATRRRNSKQNESGAEAEERAADDLRLAPSREDAEDE
jgi:hypothetical protein